MAVEDVLARARVLADLGRNAEAEPLLAQALAQEPDNEDGLALFSRVLVAGHRFREAEAVDERLLRAHPESLRGLTSMARVKCLLGRLRQVPAGSGSEFAGAVQRLGALLESHGLMTTDLRGA